MKKWLIIIGSIGFLVFLAIRGIRLQIDQSQDRRQLFVEKLDYNFAGVIDSVLSYHEVGIVRFHFTRGNPARSHEEVLNKRIKGKRLFFLMYKSDTAVEIILHGRMKAMIGDSILVNSNQNKLRILRGDSVIIESKVSSSVNDDM